MAALKRILIVDDEATVREALELVINDDAWEIESFALGQQALERLDEARFDLLLIDKNLPDVDGVELLRRFRETDKATPVVMITGYASSASAFETLHLGINAYIEKPFADIFDVVHKLNEVVAQNAERLSRGGKAEVHFARALAVLQGTTYEGPGGNLEVLVIAPQAQEREWIERQFRGGVSRVRAMGHSFAAVSHARRTPPHIVIVDADVAAPNLVQTIHLIREVAPYAGFVVVADTNPVLSVLTELIELGIAVVLTKPLDAPTFLERLEFVVGRTEPARRSLRQEELS